MMNFIYELYQNDNFVLYLTIALVVLIILFVVVLFFGKRDQKLEETKRLQKIDIDAFKEEAKEKEKLEVKENIEKTNIESTITENNEDNLPLIENNNEEIKSETFSLSDNINDSQINVTTFEPIKNIEKESEEELELPKKVEENNIRKPLLDGDEESKPISFDELDKINFDESDLEKDLNELESIKNEFNKIKVPEVEKKETKAETKNYKASPQIFSSVFVNKEDSVSNSIKSEPNKPLLEEKNDELKKEKQEKDNISHEKLFTIIDDDADDIDLPSLKSSNN